MQIFWALNTKQSTLKVNFVVVYFFIKVFFLFVFFVLSSELTI